jgi:hypothetical protein
LTAPTFSFGSGILKVHGSRFTVQNWPSERQTANGEP